MNILGNFFHSPGAYDYGYDMNMRNGRARLFEEWRGPILWLLANVEESSTYTHTHTHREYISANVSLRVRLQ